MDTFDENDLRKHPLQKQLNSQKCWARCCVAGNYWGLQGRALGFSWVVKAWRLLPIRLQSQGHVLDLSRNAVGQGCAWLRVSLKAVSA